MTDQEATEYLWICPNPNCRLVYRPDPQIYRDPFRFCPRCGEKIDLGPQQKIPAV